jgi:hypothetical protein
MAHECLMVWGETRFLTKEGCFALADRTCFARMYSNPDLVILSPRAFGNSAVLFGSPRTLSQSRSAAAVSFHSGSTLSRRPFPIT